VAIWLLAPTQHRLQDPGRFDRGVSLLLRAIGAAEPLTELMSSLPDESTPRTRRRCALRDVTFGRQLLRQLATDPVCDIAANRRWLFWDLSRRMFTNRYPGAINVGWLETSSNEKRWAVRVRDELLDAMVAVDLTPQQYEGGVWELEVPIRPSSYTLLRPAGEQRPIVTPERFLGDVEFTAGDPPGDPVGPAVAAQMSGALEDIRARFDGLTPKAQRSMLVDLYTLSFHETNRRWRIRFGCTTLGWCSSFRPSQGRVNNPLTCAQDPKGTLFREVCDSFLASTSGLMLCKEHRARYWDVEFDIIESHYNLPILGPH